MGKAEILAILRKESVSFKRLGVRKLGLFGSYATNDQKKSSDIDIAVDFNEKDKTFDAFMDLKFFLEEALGGKVDLVLRKAIRPELRKEIEKRIIYV